MSSYRSSSLYDVTNKVVLRSVRLERALDDRIEQLAIDRGLTVSAFIRATLADVSERDERRRRLERALTIAAQLPEITIERDEMWGLGTRVPR